MKQSIEFLPLIAFFVTYRFVGIFPATIVLLASSLLSFSILYVMQKKLEKMQLISLIGVLVFGGFSLLFHSESILKLKAPIINALFALIFLLSPLIVGKNLVEGMMGSFFKLSSRQWGLLNSAWVTFFFTCSLSNYWVAFYFEQYWVEFKVFGTMALTLVFLSLQMLFLAPHLRKDHS